MKAIRMIEKVDNNDDDDDDDGGGGGDCCITYTYRLSSIFQVFLKCP